MKQQIDRELVKFVVGNNIPFNAIDSPFFISFVQALRPGYTPPSRKTISDKLFWEEAARVMHYSESEIAQTNNLTLTVDGWTDGGRVCMHTMS